MMTGASIIMKGKNIINNSINDMKSAKEKKNKKRK